MRHVFVSGRPARLRAAAGFTLIEVLVSLLVFSIGVLGAVGMQAKAARFSVDASERDRAALMANEVAAAMWAARSISLDSDSEDALKSRVADNSVGAQGLPGGEFEIETQADGSAQITVTWQSVARGASGAQGVYVTQVQL